MPIGQTVQSVKSANEIWKKMHPKKAIMFLYEDSVPDLLSNKRVITEWSCTERRT